MAIKFELQDEGVMIDRPARVILYNPDDTGHTVIIEAYIVRAEGADGGLYPVIKFREVNPNEDMHH